MPRPGIRPRLLLALSAILCLAGGACARAEDFVDDFEEKAGGNLPLPDGWHPILDASHPTYNVTRIFSPYTVTPARSGRGSCKFTTAGENTALETDAFIGIIPARRYVLKVWIRTGGLVNDHAFVSVHWLDKTGIPVEVSKTPPLGGTSDWTPFELNFEDIPDTVRFARIRLNLEGLDLEGTCGFDALSLEEHLRLTVRAPGHPGFLFAEGETVSLEIACPNLGPGAYTLVHSLTDAHGRAALPPTRTPVTVDTDGLLRLRIALVPPTTGSYRQITTLLDSGGGALATQRHRLGVLPKERGVREENDFGVVIDPTDPTRDLGPALVRAFGPGKAKVVIWSKGFMRLPERTRESTIDQFVETYRSLGLGDLIGVLAAPPPSPGSSPGHGDSEPESAEGILAWLERPAAQWEPPLKNTLDRYKSLIRHWQFGGDEDVHIGRDPAAAEMFPSWRSSVQTVLRFPSLGVPAELGGADAFPESIPLGFLSLADETAVPALDLPSRLVAPSARRRFVTVAVPPRPTDDSPEAEMAGLAEFFRRITAIKTAGVDGIFLSPFAADGRGLLDREGNVTAAYCGGAAYSQALGGATWDPRSFLSEEVVHRVFRAPTRRVLVCWHDGATVEEKVTLGDGAVSFDVAGARSNLPVENGVQTLAVGPEPVLVVVRDLALFDTQISIDFSKKTLDSRSAPQERFLTITNAYPVELRGVRLRLTVPEGWGTVPEIQIPSLPPGETHLERATFVLPPSATIGPKAIRIDAHFTADRTWDIPLVRTLTVTSDLNVEIQVRDDPARKRVYVRAIVANHTSEPVSAEVYMACPGTRPRKDTLLNLLPGRAVELSRILPYLSGVESLDLDALIRVMLRDTEHRRFVNAESDVHRSPDEPHGSDR